MRYAYLLCIYLVASCSAPISTQSEYVLGTFATIKIYQRNVTSAVWNAAFEYLRDIEMRMSTSKEYSESELLALHYSAGTRAQRVSPDTYALLLRAKHISIRTNGAFNVAVLPLVRLWDINATLPSVPSAHDITAVLPLLDMQKISLLPSNQVLLEQEGMGVDVGGIAKGYVAEQVAQILREKGVAHALVDLGGNIHVVGRKPDDSLWNIGIRDPRDSYTEILATVKIDDGYSMVTSGSYERYFEQNGRRYHHIFDTHTGYPAESDLESVTIISKDGTLADALSTAFFVMGGALAKVTAKNFQNIAYVLVYKDRSIDLSAELVDTFSLSSQDYSLRPQ